MPRVLVLQHVPYEPLGTLDPLLRQRKIRIRYVNFGRDPHARADLSGYDGLIVLGGPMSVNDQAHLPHLRVELDLIAQALKRDLPILGVCLGAQLLAHCLGAAVTRNPVKELGWYPMQLSASAANDAVMSNLAQDQPIFQWHADTFALPPGTEHLAFTKGCANQAFRHGQRDYGLQFHLEVDRRLIERWLRVHEQELATDRGPLAADDIRQQTDANIASSLALSTSLFGAMLDAWGWTQRMAVLAHQR